MEGFGEHRRVPAVIGAIDGSHIPIKAPRECPENYINRKDFHSIVLQACCDHEMFFTNCYCGWPGSVHDSRVLRNSDIFDSASTGMTTSFPIIHTCWVMQLTHSKHGSWPHTRTMDIWQNSRKPTIAFIPQAEWWLNEHLPCWRVDLED